MHTIWYDFSVHFVGLHMCAAMDIGLAYSVAVGETKHGADPWFTFDVTYTVAPLTPGHASVRRVVTNWKQHRSCLTPAYPIVQSAMEEENRQMQKFASRDISSDTTQLQSL